METESEGQGLFISRQGDHEKLSLKESNNDSLPWVFLPPPLLGYPFYLDVLVFHDSLPLNSPPHTHMHTP